MVSEMPNRTANPSLAENLSSRLLSNVSSEDGACMRLLFGTKLCHLAQGGRGPRR